MAVIAKQRYKLDIAPKGGCVIVYASQHDDGAREIEFEITNQGKAFSIPASINVSVQGIKSNKSYFSHSCSYSGNVVTMALADDMTDIIGKAICVLKFTNSSQQKLATAKFILNVDSDSSSEGVIIDTEAEEIFNQMLNDIRAQASAISVDIAELQSMVGSPLVASTASAMTDHNKIYVYTGSESGYTNGNWYYWNGSAWTSGGVYNSIAFETDKTLSVENMAADAKATGKVKSDVEMFKDNLLERTKLSPYTSASNWALTSNYLSVSDNNAILYKYEVVAGDELYLNLEGYGGCTAIFQSSANVPSSGTNANKKGDAIIEDYIGYVVVPTDATYLIVSQDKNNSTNAIYSLSFIDVLSDVIKESADVNLFATGGINISTGVLTYASAVTFMTENFIADSILKVTPNAGYYVAPFAYSHGDYVGCWNGTSFSKSAQSYIRGTVNFESLRELYPDYQWRILVGRLSSSYPVDTIRPNIIFTQVIALSEKEVESDDINGLLNQTTFKRGQDTVDNLVLLHFSDIHANQDRLKDIIHYYNIHSAYIDDILDTGDDVAGQFSDGMTWWDAVDGAENILRCIGNHDAVQSQSNPSNILDMTTLAGAFFTPYVQNWEVTSYTENTTYYYKDYDNGVRLIVLDCMHASDTTQLAWLQTAFDTALSNSKHVVIGYHYPVYPYVSVNCGFTPLVSVAEDSAGVSSAIMQMVDAFQTAGGIFVCYLTGHEHHDRIMTSEAYPHQLCINIACATNVYAQYKNGDQSRYGNKYANAINLVTINPNSKCVIVKRIGADKDILGRDRISMAYNYNSHVKLYG